MDKTLLSIPDQVKIALDGRTQRWLALNMKMPEVDISKRMRGLVEFSNEEISLINKLLKSKIKNTKS